MKVLVADKSHSICEEIFKKRGIEVDVNVGMNPDELKKVIGNYDAIIIRSATTLTKEIIDTATNLKVAVRAGIGVDNIDIPACTEKNILVMNTPFGNAVSTAEHAIAMMMAVCRCIPQAHKSTHEGKWEKKKFGKGVEVFEKTLGVIGCGNIGSIVADRAKGLRMNVIAFDPGLTPERAKEIGVEKVELDDLYKRADIITYHVAGKGAMEILNKEAIAKMKDGVRIVNCARGKVAVEKDVKEALESGKITGYATDVYYEEPAKEHVFFGTEQVVCTPHIAASTHEAQRNVAQQAAEQIADYLLDGKITNAKNEVQKVNA